MTTRKEQAVTFDEIISPNDQAIVAQARATIAFVTLQVVGHMGQYLTTLTERYDHTWPRKRSDRRTVTVTLEGMEPTALMEHETPRGLTMRNDGRAGMGDNVTLHGPRAVVASFVAQQWGAETAHEMFKDDLGCFDEDDEED